MCHRGSIHSNLTAESELKISSSEDSLCFQSCHLPDENKIEALIACTDGHK